MLPSGVNLAAVLEGCAEADVADVMRTFPHEGQVSSASLAAAGSSHPHDLLCVQVVHTSFLAAFQDACQYDLLHAAEVTLAFKWDQVCCKCM